MAYKASSTSGADRHTVFATGAAELEAVMEALTLLADGPVDHLDHASYQHSFGGKIGLDATAKVSEEGYTRSWPEVIQMDPEVKERVEKICKELDL